KTASPATVDVFNASSAAGVSSSDEAEVLGGPGFKEGRPTTAPTDPGTKVAQQGPMVDARSGGGIPCVF
ncbi:hypothetical protein, partial [Streptomyces sp. FH025]|uniref:hypothetical protein n=1 Tax=Streptomyces sp. FH025 TaxID=2815937 RepID=UPI001A9DF397